MTSPITLSIYITRQFFGWTLVMHASLTGLVSLFDFIELLRRAATKPNATFGIVSEIAALRIPYIGLHILPFAVLLGGIIALWRLTRSSELIVARAAGVSAWEFLAGPVFCAILLGAVNTAAISPLSSIFFARAEQMQDAYLNTSGGPVALTGGQMWLRQADDGLQPQGVAIIHAKSVVLKGKTLAASMVSVYRLDGADRLLSRIEAKGAVLAPGEWMLQDARTLEPNRAPQESPVLPMKTDLTVLRVQESFASPDTLSFWALPGFINLLERSGFSSIRHRLHFQSLLAMPLLCGTMALVAAGFSMRPARRGGVARMLGSGVAAGFALFVISRVAEEFGQSGALPVLLAAWAPAASGLLFAVTLLLHVEGG